MIETTILPSKGIVIVEPDGALSASDFEKLTEAVDAYLEGHAKLQGLMIHIATFPGWEDFEGFIGHMRFVRDHHQEIEKVALVTDTKFADILPKIAQHFVSAEIKRFPYAEKGAGLSWLED
ncbi:STAS/SEC14 domain-containing protein [Rubritalea tangerina]|uniref:STAS/SEC14 domain-containing protein n=1 Tax=Rubritalea tangerina TaxID=430798 RepID=A0ABW4Z6I4_9BACT